jgi:hypothetical protein
VRPVNAEQFLSWFERRGFTVLFKNESLRVIPITKLTSEDRAAIAQADASAWARWRLGRLLQQRESQTRVTEAAMKMREPRIFECDCKCRCECARCAPDTNDLGPCNCGCAQCCDTKWHRAAHAGWNHGIRRLFPLAERGPQASTSTAPGVWPGNPTQLAAAPRPAQSARRNSPCSKK